MRVLHITNWYPTVEQPMKAIWIKQHIDALEEFCSNHVYHVEVEPADEYSFKFFENSNNRKTYRVKLPTRRFFIIEIISAFLLFYILLFKIRLKNYDLINFHIAYPLLTYWWIIKKMIKVPVVITEHWSAYHFNFGLPPSVRLSRIRRIFKQGIPLIAVSEALANDIKHFSKANFPTHIVPNIVDDLVYFADDSCLRQNFFFMVSQWKWPKQPITIFEAFKEFTKIEPDFKLKVGGYGPDYPLLKTWIEENKMNRSIELLGTLQAQEIARFFRHCRAFLQCTEYETFSVVCAEAVSCHTPLVVSRVGGIQEVVKTGEGIYIDSNEPSPWLQGMQLVLTKPFTFNQANRFSKNNVGHTYFEVLLHYIYEAQK
jgi:glycosyltransferase involved in cell wall biosynthesis